MTPDLLLTCPSTFPGVASALKNLCGVTSGSIFRNFEDVVYRGPKRSSRVWGRGSRRLQNRLKLFDLSGLLPFGDNIILGGWSPLYETVLEKLNRKGVRPSLMWCSTLGQAEMTKTELSSFLSVLSHVKERRIAHLFLHKRLFPYKELFSALRGNDSVVYMPHAIDLERVKVDNREPLEGRNADLFCPFRYGKNVLTQLLGAVAAETDFVLHMNVRAPWLEEVLSELRGRVIVHPWFDESAYWRFLAAMDFSLQVTHTESFNYAVCERMSLGIPVLATHNIWLVSGDDFLKKHLCVDAPDTPQSIAKSIDALLKEDDLRSDLGSRCRERITGIAEEHNQIVRERVRELFGTS